jgi:F-type H+-transporting ATPase subunit delta
MAKLAATVYGEALYELAMEKEGKDLPEEAEELLKVLADNPSFDQLMKHPGISKANKLDMITKVFRDRVSREMEGFLHVVVMKERYGELQKIFRYFIDKIKEERKIGTAYVTTAEALTDSRQKQIHEKLLSTTTYQEMEIHYEVDPRLIGGMIIRIKDRVVDGSIRRKLDDMTKQLLEIKV